MSDEKPTTDVDAPLEHLNGLSTRQFHELASAAEHTLVMMTGRNPEAYCTLLADLAARLVMDGDETQPPTGDAFLANFHSHLDKVVATWRESIKARATEAAQKLN